MEVEQVQGTDSKWLLASLTDAELVAKGMEVGDT